MFWARFQRATADNMQPPALLALRNLDNVVRHVFCLKEGLRTSRSPLLALFGIEFYFTDSDLGIRN